LRRSPVKDKIISVMEKDQTEKTAQEDKGVQKSADGTPREGFAYKFRTAWMWGFFIYCLYYFFKNPPLELRYPGYFTIITALLFCFPPLHRIFLRYHKPVADTITRSLIVLFLLAYYSYLLETVPKPEIEADAPVAIRQQAVEE